MAEPLVSTHQHSQHEKLTLFALFFGNEEFSKLHEIYCKCSVVRKNFHNHRSLRFLLGLHGIAISGSSLSAFNSCPRGLERTVVWCFSSKCAVAQEYSSTGVVECLKRSGPLNCVTAAGCEHVENFCVHIVNCWSGVLHSKRKEKRQSRR